jgi:predicted helicase
MLKTYLKRLHAIHMQGDAREESYYSALEGLFNDYAESAGKKNVRITVLPKRTEAGNPDFRIWDGRQHITGYIEAKDISVHNLAALESSGQIKKYLSTFPNLILTNFFEFRLYVNGSFVESVQVGRPFIVYQLEKVPPVENEEAFLRLLEKYFSFSLPKVHDAKTLAVELAKRTRFLKDEVIAQELREEERTGKGFIRGFYKAFRDYLIGSLTEDEFSDLYAQTITYGLFAARTRSENGFNRKLAYDNIPQTIGILRDVFQFVSLGSLPKQMEWIIDDISEILSVTDTNKLLHQFFHEGKGKDPIIHFYETFLSEYDPKTREMRGVYYTPEPVVSYIVRSLHAILKERFKKPLGFADNNITVLDPAAGTLTFLAETAKLALDEFATVYGGGGKKNFIKDHILQNFYAFELMMAPYAVGHLKMSFLLEELGYKLQKDDRVKLYLTNTLEMEDLAQTELPGMASLSEESHLAGKVKKEQPILVILGNPPYSVSSVNKSDFIEREMNVYKEDVRTERNIQPLSDDYIKFIRFAHWKIANDGKGLVGMITNNSYLSGLIHRGMRKKLFESFDEIYILNLHGNSRIGEKTPGGGKDENVFDIQQGVSIALFVKNPSTLPGKVRQKRSGPKVFYQDVYGLREEKYSYLNSFDVRTTQWIELKPSEPYHFFVVKDFSLQSDYDKFISITEIFDKYSFGITTARDSFIVNFNENEAKRKMQTFMSDLPDNLVSMSLNLKDSEEWNIKSSREAVKKTDWKQSIKPYSYRPFDKRTIIYLSALVERDRIEIMQHLSDKDNLCLSLTRRLRDPDWKHVFATHFITDKTLLSSRDNCYCFPLYLYQGTEKRKKSSLKSVMMLFEPKADYLAKKSNLSSILLERLKKNYGRPLSAQEIFYYIYAVLYSEIYRTKYAEFLKIDFPRVPFTKDYKLFKKTSAYGNRLVDLHLLKSSELDSPVVRFQGKGDNRVSKPEYNNATGFLYINKEQYFEGITIAEWIYQIGGYQVCDKWLKDRKGRILSLEEIKLYCRIVTALKNTIAVQKEIDNIYPSIEKDVMAIL